jgi:uncharacterized protein YaeQ
VLTATMRRFEISLADSDRDRYEQLDLRAAHHPSESERYLITRVIARALEHADGLEFSKGGVSDDEEPALIQRDLRGDLLSWIEVSNPSPDRLHKAAKACKRVLVYTWRSIDELADAIAERKVYKPERIELVQLDEAFVDAVVAKLDRNNRWDLAVTGGSLYLTIGEELFETTPRRRSAAS